jgi:hypothetical protein
MVLLVKGDGCLGPPEPCWGADGVDGVHLLLSDATLLAGFIYLEAPDDHAAALDLRELVVFLLGAIRWVTSLWGRLLGLALLAEGATDVALHGCIVFEKVLRLPPMERVGGLERLLKVFQTCNAPVGLRSGGMVGHGNHLLPTVLPILIPPVAVSLR